MYLNSKTSRESGLLKELNRKIAAFSRRMNVEEIRWVIKAKNKLKLYSLKTEFSFIAKFSERFVF